MTKVKKLLGMMMAALLCFAFTPTAAFAVGESCTITVENAVPGQTYNLYKMADLTVASGEVESYVYTVAEGWLPFWQSIASDEGKYGIKLVDDSTIVFDGASMNDDDAKVADLAEAAKAYNKSGIAANTAMAPQEGALTFTGLEFGYYFLDSTTGTLCSLTTVNDHQNIIEKNGVPAVELQVLQAEDNWVESNHTFVSDTLQFRSVVYIAKGATNYTYHDQMSDGLALQGDIHLFKATKNADNVYTQGDPIQGGYILVDQPSGICDFEVVLEDSLLADNAEGFVMIVFNAQLNSNAAITTPESGLLANTNESWVTYGTANGTEQGQSGAATTNTYTYGMDVLKYTGSTDNKLAGATFALKRIQSDSTNDNLKFATPAEGSTTFMRDQYGTVDTFTTTETGSFTLQGIDSGEFYLYETVAPNGYNKLDAPVRIYIDPDTGTITVGNGDNAAVSSIVAVENLTGAQLPSTGGMGTTILYVVGAVLVIGAVIFFVRRRSSAK